MTRAAYECSLKFRVLCCQVQRTQRPSEAFVSVDGFHETLFLFSVDFRRERGENELRSSGKKLASFAVVLRGILGLTPAQTW